MVLKALSSFSGFDLAKYVGFALLATVVVGVFFYQEHRIEKKDNLIIEYEGALTAAGDEINKNILINEHNDKEFKTYKEDHALVIEQLKVQHKQELNDLKLITLIKGDIKNVKENDDGPAATVLKSTIYSLYKFQNPDTKDSKADRVPKATSTK